MSVKFNTLIGGGGHGGHHHQGGGGGGHHQKRDKKPKMSDAEVLSHLSEYSYMYMYDYYHLFIMTSYKCS